MVEIEDGQALVDLERFPGGDHEYDSLTHIEISKTDQPPLLSVDLLKFAGPDQRCELVVDLGSVGSHAFFGTGGWRSFEEIPFLSDAEIRSSPDKVSISITKINSSPSHYWIKGDDLIALRGWLT